LEARLESANGDFLDFTGKAVLITGAATGIGRAVALGFASRGAKVAIGDINEEAAGETLDLSASTASVAR
jgi:NAD(P)-dependent dehydrogenase (short-subunit alcohol dehydrogenase family)